MFLKRCALSLLAALAVTGTVLPRQAAPRPERIAFERLSNSFAVAALAGDEIWPGFDIRKYAFALSSPGKGAYLIGYDTAPEGSSKAEGEMLGLPVYFTPDSRALSANTSAIVAGRNTAIIQTRDLDAPVEDGVALIFHEAFHAFEHDPGRKGVKWGREDSRLVSEYPEASAKNNALFRVESLALYSALRCAFECGDEEDVIERARRFVAVRKLRQGELESRMAEFEEATESNEGLAEYAGLKAALLGIDAASRGRLPLGFESRDGKGYLLKRLDGLETIMNRGSNSRGRFYLTGSAQAFLLDRLVKGWKERIQREGATPRQILEDKVLRHRESWSSLAQSTLARYDYALILKEEEASLAKKEAAKQAVLNSVLARPGRRYIVEFSGVDRMGAALSFDPMNIAVINARKRVHTRMLRIGKADLYEAEFNQPVVEDLANKQYVTVSSPDHAERLTVDGAPLDLTKPSKVSFNKIAIHSPGFRLEGGPGVVAVTAGGVVVRF